MWSIKNLKTVDKEEGRKCGGQNTLKNLRQRRKRNTMWMIKFNRYEERAEEEEDGNDDDVLEDEEERRKQDDGNEEGSEKRRKDRKTKRKRK